MDEVCQKEIPQMQAALEQIDRELPGLRHETGRELQAACQDAYAAAVRQVAAWFDDGATLAARLDQLYHRAAKECPAPIEQPGFPSLPPAAGLPPIYEVLVAVFGTTERSGLASLFKTLCAEWRLDALAQDDPERQRIEHQRRVEAEGERQAAKRKEEMRRDAAKAAGVTARTVFAPPPSARPWFPGPALPSVSERGLLTGNTEVEEARQELAKASAAFIDIDSARARGEATREEAEAARQALDRAKVAFSAAEARAVTLV
jgi:hypothetical protein